MQREEVEWHKRDVHMRYDERSAAMTDDAMRRNHDSLDEFDDEGDDEC